MTVLDELGAQRCWIVAREVHEADGKINKVPVEPTTGSLYPKDSGAALNPAHWMTGHEAALWAQQLGPGHWPGLVLHPELGVFCLDLDHCRAANGGWFPHVVAFLNRFPAALVETSVSGGGRHMFVRYTGELPPHGVDNELYRMQGYSRNRFILTTGSESTGSLSHPDYTRELVQFLAEFFPDKPVNYAEWTSTPVPEWRGPEDDNELLARMIRQVSPRAIFGGGAAFSDLWRANADVLGKAFPSRNNRDPYDRSGADQALFNHLAFWTGNNCERMLHISRGSGLVRQKWLDREENYLKPTILSSCVTQREWYCQGGEEPRTTTPEVVDSSPAGSGVPAPPPPGVTIELVGVPKAPPVAPAEEILAPGELPAVGEYASIHIMKQLFAGMCYVQDMHAIQMADGSTITKERFDARFGGPQFAMTNDGQKPTKSAWDAYTLSEIYRFPRVETQYFKPGEATGTIRTREGRREINSYRPADIRRVKGDPSPFIDLVRRMLPNGQDADILLYYMAACTRYIGTKFQWAIFLQATKGNGKSTIGKVLEYCVSKRYTHWAKASELGEKFNSVFVEKLLVIVDEMYNDDRREFEEILKIMVTSDRQEVRPMYGEKTMKEVCYNMVLISNHQNGIRIDMDERRYAPLFCAQQTKEDNKRDGLTRDYFIQLRKWLWDNDSQGAAIVYDYLMDLAIPDELNPATDCITAPYTTSTELAATASLGGIEQELIEAIKQQHDGFRNGWISSFAVDMLLARCGKDRAIPRNARKNLVTALGYVAHPSLEDGVCTAPMVDGSMPRLFVTKGHAWAVDYLLPEQVRQGFLDSQKRS